MKNKMVPVIMITDEEPMNEAILAVNLLHSGCPGVQMVIRNGHQERNVTHINLRDILVALQLPDEKFWLFGSPKLEKKGFTVMEFLYHPLHWKKKKSPTKRKGELTLGPGRVRRKNPQ